MRKDYIKPALIILIFLTFLNCKSSKYMDVKIEYERVTDMHFFDDNIDTITQKNIYPVKKEYLENRKFVLKHNGFIFFKGDYTKNDYLFEGIEGKFFFITPIKLPNNLASPFLAKRDSVFLYDLENNKLYNFSAIGYLILASKKRPPKSIEFINRYREKGYDLRATYYSVSIETKVISLLLEDLKTVENINLKIIEIK
jgi:hypothetical protein